MLTKWFGTRSSPSLKKDPSFRPWLERLEERNAPGGGGHDGGDDHDHGDGGDHDHDHGDHGPPVPAPVNNGVNNNVSASAGNGNHGSFNNSTITGSFNNTITNTINNTVNVTLMPAQSFAVEGLLAYSGFLSSALSNPQLGTLLDDEIALAVDQYLTNPTVAQTLNLPQPLLNTLSSDATTLTNAISGITANNPFAAAIGNLAHDVTLNALTSAGMP